MVLGLTREEERRVHERIGAQLSCKLLPQGGAKYLPGKTTNVSAGGAQIRVMTSRPLKNGDKLSVAVSWESEAILSKRGLSAATVVRSGPVGSGEQTVALRFEQAQKSATIGVRASAAKRGRTAA
ncbi:MAG: PilZ domain-containing protein [Planctomycetota bacterium]